MPSDKKQVSTWLDEELVARLDIRCEEEDRTRSKILERALLRYLNSAPADERAAA